jgi:Domain of unknown function (DUF4160)
MPVLYEYFGLVIHFYSDEHDPIHVHVEYNDCVSIADGLIILCITKASKNNVLHENSDGHDKN